MKKTEVAFQRVTKRFETPTGTITALHDVSFTVKGGEFVAIVGASGAGKTTILQMIGALDKPDYGEISVDGERLSRFSDEEAALYRRRRVGIVYQFYNLVPELTVGENITLPAEMDRKTVDEARLRSVLEEVGLTEKRHAYPALLSGGQQQRVAIARVLYNRPSLILADEPTGNLDPQTADEIMAVFRRLNREEGVTVIAVTHSEKFAEAADRILRIEKGSLVEGRGA